MSAIEGVYAAAVTPRRLGTQDINLGAMWEIVDHLVSNGAEGIVLLGATGEFAHFSNAERMRMVGLAAKRSRVPVIINCSHTTADGAVELAQCADASGAAAILLMPPYFFNYSQSQILDFYRHVIEQAELETPVLLYNLPQFTSGLTFETIDRLIREGLVKGIKDSSGDLALFTRLQELRAQVPMTLMVGNDALAVQGRSTGCDGIISGVACAVPELLVALDRAVTKQVPESVSKLQSRLTEFIEWTDKLPVPVAIKEATSLRGLKLGPHALACDGEFLKVLEQFRVWFREWLPLVRAECKHV